MEQRIQNPAADGHRHAPRDPGGIIAFSIYLALSLAVFGIPLWGHFRDASLAKESSPILLMWCMVWWPTAIARGLNPFYTRFFWAPIGINMAWMPSIPLPSLVMWPVTAVWGPVAAYNILGLLSAPLAGWSAFVLCRHIARSWWPSLMGGYIFGFSAYLLNEVAGGDRHLSLVFLVPLIVLAVLRAIFRPDPRPAGFIAMLAALLAAEFLISTEVSATLAAFGALTLALGWLFAPRQTRRRVIKAALWIAAAYLGAAIILSPYIYWLFDPSYAHGEIWPGGIEHWYPTLLSFVRPTDLNQFHPANTGRIRAWYIGAPLLAIAGAYAWRNWRTPLGKTLIASFATICLLSLGANLRIYGPIVLPLPGRLLLHLPLIDKALPNRFMLYSLLGLAIMAALWFSSNHLSVSVNSAIAALVIISTLPSFSFPWTQPVIRLPFFTSGRYREYLRPGENVLVIPFGWRGDSMLWAAESGLYFRLAGGWSDPFRPVEFDQWPIYPALIWVTYMPDAAEQLGAFMAYLGVDAAVVADLDPGAAYWGTLLSRFSSAKAHVGGVTVYRIAPAALAPYREVAAAQMRRRAASAAIGSLVMAAVQWSKTGRGFEQFNPSTALESGVLKPSWCAGSISNSVTDAAHHWFCGAEIGGTTSGNVMIGIPGVYAELEPAIGRYRNSASHIYFPFPRDLLSPATLAPAPNQRAFLRMEFTPAQIAAIAARRPEPAAQL